MLKEIQMLLKMYTFVVNVAERKIVVMREYLLMFCVYYNQEPTISGIADELYQEDSFKPFSL